MLNLRSDMNDRNPGSPVFQVVKYRSWTIYSFLRRYEPKLGCCHLVALSKYQTQPFPRNTVPFDKLLN